MTSDVRAGIDRRHFLTRAGAATAAAAIAGSPLRPAVAADGAVPLTPGTPDGLPSVARLEALPGKKPLIKLSYRPPNYETPLQYFNEVLTPNDAFFVRYHLANIPEVSAAEWRLKIGGDAVERPAEYDLAALKSGFEQVELVAVCQCSGNRRGLSVPHVQGVEWGYGAMGNARWRGVRLKDVLAKSGVKKEALEVWLNGAETPIVDSTPDFVKSLPVWKALDENTIIAFEMNGQSLPHYNGFPARLIVAGWTGTYWTKHITNVDVHAKALSNFWMAAAYRIPTGKFPLVDHFVSQENAASTPITEMVVNSVMTNIRDGQRIKAGQALDVKGIAWDGGYGIQAVDVSTDAGKSWRPSTLGQDLGRYSFRPWSYRFTPPRAGTYPVMARATNRVGATQTFVLNFNPAGYHNNVVQLVNLVAA
jgi:DMSO/TMAO reductase YedYZ molybdopterin-dependent catalytic subunit